MAQFTHLKFQQTQGQRTKSLLGTPERIWKATGSIYPLRKISFHLYPHYVPSQAKSTVPGCDKCPKLSLLQPRQQNTFQSGVSGCFKSKPFPRETETIYSPPLLFNVFDLPTHFHMSILSLSAGECLKKKILTKNAQQCFCLYLVL